MMMKVIILLSSITQAQVNTLPYVKFHQMNLLELNNSKSKTTKNTSLKMVETLLECVVMKRREA